MPTNVCKATYRPQSNGNLDLHSSMYVCEPNGTFVYQYHWNNNTLCQGPPNFKAIAYTNQSHFNCQGDICPYAIMRFYDKERTQDPDECIKNDTEWAEAIFTTYQCLHDDNDPPNILPSVASINRAFVELNSFMSVEILRVNIIPSLSPLSA